MSAARLIPGLTQPALFYVGTQTVFRRANELSPAALQPITSRALKPWAASGARRPPCKTFSRRSAFTQARRRYNREASTKQFECSPGGSMNAHIHHMTDEFYTAHYH